MAVTPGTRLGVYEVTAPIGEGGMGQVYRATDTTLGRQVAIKILPDAFAADPERLARFEREAKTLASLNHPHIAAIYAVEKSAGVHALVMELVEGEDLSQRIARGAIPIDDALPIAKQIAEALEAAHEQGIIHRDLKPANIKVRADGTVKVLDFGLAKAMDPPGKTSVNAMDSPTLSMHATKAGIILGTAAYMSPEQARGKTVDRRADIWAFGCVVFEMLTGARAFRGDDVTDTIVSVVSKEPEWTVLPSTVPPDVRRLLLRCLKKDPRARMRDVGEARLAIEEGLSVATTSGATTATAASDAMPAVGTRRTNLAAMAACLIGAGLAALGTWALTRTSPTSPPRATRFAIVPPPAQTLDRAGSIRAIALSPDGMHIVYVGGPEQGQLFVRAIDQLETRAVTGTSGAGNPFFSPDGRWIGFFDGTDRTFKKVPIIGGPPVTIHQVTAGSGSVRGASWGEDDTIVFATTDPATGLLAVPSGGGDAKVLTKADTAQGELDHAFPSVLPGARGVLFTITASRPENAQVAVLDLRTGQRKTLVRGGSNAEYVAVSAGSAPRGYIVYATAGTLRAVRFDLARLEVTGDPVLVVEHVMAFATGAANFAISSDGTLVYAPGGLTNARQLAWVDRNGREELINAPPRAYVAPRISPDGARLALDIRDQDSDIWIWDFARQTLTRLTFDPAVDMQPVWTPDSRRILFASQRNGPANLFSRAADGTGADQRLTTGPNAQFPDSVAPDGGHVLAHGFLGSGNKFDVMQVPLDSASAPHASEPLVQTKFDELNADFSPDGRYFAYQSDESGPYEIYVRPYPNVNGGRWQMSTAGGTRPRWAHTGLEIFYLDAAGMLTSVAVQTTGPTFSAGNPAKLFDGRYATPINARTYDVSPDGRRFVMIKEGLDADKESPSLVVVERWVEELKAKVPQSKWR